MTGLMPASLFLWCVAALLALAPVAIALPRRHSATAIVYAASLAPENLRRWLRLNPMLHFVTAYQDIVTKHTVPSLTTFILLAVLATVSLWAGWTVFARAQKRFAEYV